MNIKKKSFALNIIGALFTTNLRMIILVVAPILLFFKGFLFSCKINKQVLWLFIIIIISSIISLLNGFVDFASVILYIWICFPLLYFLFAEIKPSNPKITWPLLFSILRKWVILIDLLGFIFFTIIDRSVDSFGTMYGNHFKGVSGLCVVNAIFLFYYLSLFTKCKHNNSITKNILFFLVSFILCFSGLTLISFVVTIVLYLICIANIKSLFKYIYIILLCCLTLIFFGDNIVQYNQRNIEKFLSDDEYENNARKRVMYIDFIHLVSTDYSVSLIGVGPGGYNSRTSFLLNNDSENIFTNVLGHHMPFYHKKYIYPLWNKNFVSFNNFNDGARNKPFSSLVAFYSEIGLIFFFFFSFFWFKKTYKLYKLSNSDPEYLFLFLLNMFFYILMLTEYWFESTEMLLFIIIQNSLLSYKKSIIQNKNFIETN